MVGVVLKFCVVRRVNLIVFVFDITTAPGMIVVPKGELFLILAVLLSLVLVFLGPFLAFLRLVFLLLVILVSIVLVFCGGLNWERNGPRMY